MAESMTFLKPILSPHTHPNCFTVDYFQVVVLLGFSWFIIPSLMKCHFVLSIHGIKPLPRSLRWVCFLNVAFPWYFRIYYFKALNIFKHFLSNLTGPDMLGRISPYFYCKGTIFIMTSCLLSCTQIPF